MLKKAEEYFANGTKLVWVADRVSWMIEVGEELSGALLWPDLKVDLEAAFRGI